MKEVNMKTAEELFKLGKSKVAGYNILEKGATTDIFLQVFIEALTEHDSEIIAKIDEMIEENKRRKDRLSKDDDLRILKIKMSTYAILVLKELRKEISK